MCTHRVPRRFSAPTQLTRIRPLLGIPRVELRGFEPLRLPAEIQFDLQVRSISVRFSPAGYLRFCFRVLTASRVIAPFLIRSVQHA